MNFLSAVFMFLISLLSITLTALVIAEIPFSVVPPAAVILFGMTVSNLLKFNRVEKKTFK